MDLLQPEIMSQIVDDGVLGVQNNGIGSLQLVWTLGLKMIVLVVFGGFSGSMNNMFVHMTGQNIGNEIRKDCFRNIMTFSFPQVNVPIRFISEYTATARKQSGFTSSKGNASSFA